MLLEIATDWTTKFETMSEKLFLASTIMIVGFLIVFVILTIIIFSIKFMSASINFSSRFNKSKKIDTNLVPSQEETLTSDKVTVDLNQSDISDDELVAVLSAAIAAFTSSSVRTAPYPGFKIRRAKRIG